MILESLPERPLSFEEVADLDDHEEISMAWPIEVTGYSDEPLPRWVHQVLLEVESGHVGLSYVPGVGWEVIARDDEQDAVTDALSAYRAVP